MIDNKFITVSQLNAYIKMKFDSDVNLSDIFISGEISNFKTATSGHLYFSLKDSKSVVRAVMFAGEARKVQFNVSDGMSVIVRGRVSSYEASGQYQVYVKDIQPQGQGSVYLIFEQLKAKLLSEGLFDDSLKKRIPKYPKKIGVVTSRTGAVIHDIKTVVSRRYPLCEIVLYPVEVQGERAASQIVKGINYFNKFFSVDVIIIGRGGGSLEELWAFNKEEVARAIFVSQIPVISAVGHETDVTICDFVADKRAATPSVAAEIAVPDMNILKSEIKNNKIIMKKLILSQLEQLSYAIKSYKNFFEKNHPTNMIKSRISDLSQIKNRLFRSYENFVLKNKNRYEILKKGLNLCSEKFALKRGYSLILRGSENIKHIEQITENMEVEIYLSNGKIKCNLSNIKII